jgi:hypothetical protein
MHTDLFIAGRYRKPSSGVTCDEMGPARPPYLAPDDAAEKLKRRLPALQETL